MLLGSTHQRNMSILHIYENQNRQYPKLFHWQMNKTCTAHKTYIHVSGIHNNTQIHTDTYTIYIIILLYRWLAGMSFPNLTQIEIYRFAKLFNLLRNADPLYFRATQHWMYNIAHTEMLTINGMAKLLGI